MVKAEIGKRITDLREQYNISQDDLAARLGISSGFLGLVEKGSRGTTVSKLIAISNIFRVSLDYLLAGREKRPMRTSVGSLTFIENTLSKQEQFLLVELAKDISTCQYNAKELELLFNTLHSTVSFYRGIKDAQNNK